MDIVLHYVDKRYKGWTRNFLYWSWVMFGILVMASKLSSSLSVDKTFLTLQLAVIIGGMYLAIALRVFMYKRFLR